MNMPAPLSAAQQYDRILRSAKNLRRLSPDVKRPQPTSTWPPENVRLLEQYRAWLLSGGISPASVGRLYLPMAGYVLGLTLKPYLTLDLTADFQPAIDYVRAKNASANWNHVRVVALDKFRQFLRQQRGQVEIDLGRVDYARYVVGLPAWLVVHLERYYHFMRAHWRPARVEQQSRCFWSSHTVIWRWVCERHAITGSLDLKRQYLLEYVDHLLVAGYAASTINNHLRTFHAFLLYLQEQDFHIPQALLEVPFLKQPDRLPRFLTDEQVCQVRDDFEQRVAQARFPAQRRDALLDRAAFYLMWHGGLRLGEVEELRLEDLDLPQRKLMVRQGKGQKDRAVYLTDMAVRAVQDYLTVRGQGEDDHVFLYRHRPVCKDLLHSRITAAGKRVGVKVTPHQLRHTCATQLLNAGCKITSIQQQLGHRKLDSTLIYARVHDEAIASDYYAAMSRIEKSLEIPAKVEDVKEQTSEDTLPRTQLLAVIDQLAVPQLRNETRLDLVAQMRHLLNGHAPQPTLATVC